MKNDLPAQPEAIANETASPAPEAEETQTEENQEGANSPGSNETKWMRWVVVLVGALTVVVILGMLMLYLQLDDIHDSIKAATTDVVMHDERAWLEPLGVDTPFAVGSPLSITVKAVNGGKTLAKKCVVYLDIRRLKPPGVPVMAILDSKSKPQVPTSLVIAPGQQVTFPPVVTPKALPRGVFDEVESGEVRMFILGTLTYDDVFKKHHWIEFCYVFDPGASQWVAAGNAATDEE